jgi:hypothetical protein
MQTRRQLSVEAPELIVLTRGATGNYLWKRPNTSFKERQFTRNPRYDATPEVEAYVNDLLAAGSGWSVVTENSSEVLLARNR